MRIVVAATEMVKDFRVAGSCDIWQPQLQLRRAEIAR